MCSLTIRGVDVQFPFSPYPSQKDYMEKVLECLQEGKNGILESPTGTGKTVCLLCAALAWQERLKSERLDLVLDKPEVEATSRPVIPKIIYSSRTHSQLSQAIHELKNTRYKPTVAILGSRDQLCLDPMVSKAGSNTEKVHLCRSKVQSGTCQFYNNFKENSSNLTSQLSQHMPDIEELVKEGAKQKVCPYYLARELKSSADIIFMPFNYIFDAKLRDSHRIDLENAIVICDEAHHIGNMCEESSSFELSSSDLASCLQDINKCLRLKRKKRESLVGEVGQFLTVYKDEGERIDEELESIYAVKALVVSLTNAIDELYIPCEENGLTKPGSFMIELLNQCQLKQSNHLVVASHCERILLSVAANASNRSYSLQKILDMIKLVFQPLSFESTRDGHVYYKVHVRSSADQKQKGQRTWKRGRSASDGRTLSYWCFSPGLALNDLVAKGVHSVILTSGTLSPISSFSAELKIPFPVSIENPHVIQKHQVFAGVLNCGPDKVPLNSSYRNRFSLPYLWSLGKTLVRLSEVVPNGLLVFFPCYPFLSQCVDAWQRNGLWKELSSKKPVFLDHKEKMGFHKAMNGFNEKIQDPNCREAIFLAVFRGKAAEGLDFADRYGRAVAITGLPFLPKTDPKVTLKMLYLNECVREALIPPKEALTGNAWYCQQALRAVNQAIGRVIRHRSDFGAILFCDSRFSARDVQSQLPKWIRPCINYEDFEKLSGDLRDFFTYAERTLPPPIAKDSDGLASFADCKPTADSDATDSCPCPVQHASSCSQTFKPVQTDAKNEASLVKETAGSSAVRLVLLLSRTNPKVVEVPASYLETKEKDGRSGKIEEAQCYHAEVRDALHNEAYVAFLGVVAKYNKEKDLDSLVSGLHKAFGWYNPAKRRLLEGFQKFLKPRHRETYQSKCLEIGEKCFETLIACRSVHDSNGSGEPAAKKVKVAVQCQATVNEEQPPNNLCPVCKKDYRVPYFGPCTHCCCFRCWIKELKVAKKCPVCQHPVRKRQLKQKCFFSK
ncbi:regulator of telomere elongation helicase 1-like [Oscarella lobularis]|uniref:regulator of telomere elongation helicase 1-like n=1 Tax=Oscarella lobularis TaxID=121494 RepID=UPI003313C2D3